MNPHENSLPHSPEAESAPLGGILLEVRSMSDAEQRLLDFVGSLILDVARTDSRVRDLDVALWIAQVAVGAAK
jgi:hypothetical protein